MRLLLDTHLIVWWMNGEASKISERAVALFRMFAVSFISTRNVLSPAARLSDAPTRVKMRSHNESVASAAGTKQPACASSCTSATCRISVLLPAIFGPVTRRTCRSSPLSSMLLGT